MQTVQSPATRPLVNRLLGFTAPAQRPLQRLATPVWNEVAAQLFHSLAIVRLPEGECQRKDILARAHAESIGTLARARQDANALLAALAGATIEVRGCDFIEARSLREAKRRELLPAVPVLDFSPPRAIPLELLATGTPAAIQSSARQELGEVCSFLVGSLFGALDSLLLTARLGTIDWLAEDVCRYRFFRNVVVRERGPEKETRTATHVRREREVIDTHRVATHTHELINARSEPLPARHVRKPAHVEALIGKTPSWIAPFLRVASGDEVRELIVETDVRTDKQVEEQVEVIYRPDPALTLGRYVLAGWSDRDLPPLGAGEAVLRWLGW
jgi:hypothetical protein